jgi:hypothetical protein
VLTPAGVQKVLPFGALLLTWAAKAAKDALVSRGWQPGFSTALVAQLPPAIA